MTIQEKYLKHINGEMGRVQFLVEARKDPKLSQFITNLTSYDDAIKILKNRGIINEARKKTVESLSLDQANPYEYKKGLEYELNLSEISTPNISFEEFDKVQQKVLSNLAKDPNFYTKTCAGIKPDGDLASDSEMGGKSSRADVYYKFKDNLVDKNNGVKEVSKLDKTNVKDTLGNKEKAKNKVPKGVKVMAIIPKKVKGVKVMALPGKEKKIKIKESYSLLNLLENIPQTNSTFLPFAKVKPGMIAKDDSGESFKVINKGDYNSVKKYDTTKSMSKFISSDPSGIDANQLVALIDNEGNTFVRIYGTGGVYVFDSNVNEYSNADDVRNKEKAYLQAKMKMFQNKINSLNEDDNFEPEIQNKEVPQDEEAKAEAKAAILVTITKANLQSNINLDKDIAVRAGYIWVKVPLGYGSLSKDQLKALCGDSRFQGLNPLSNTELTLIFDKK